VQQYFAEHEYPNVTVFLPWRNAAITSERGRRAGSSPPNDRKDFSYYAAKDIVMAREAQCGVMLWDAKSKGTLPEHAQSGRSASARSVYFAPTGFSRAGERARLAHAVGSMP